MVKTGMALAAWDALFLAHAGTLGGVSIEALLFAAALLVLAAIFYRQRSAPRPVILLMVILAIVLGVVAFAFREPDDETHHASVRPLAMSERFLGGP